MRVARPATDSGQSKLGSVHSTDVALNEAAALDLLLKEMLLLESLEPLSEQAIITKGRIKNAIFLKVIVISLGLV